MLTNNKKQIMEKIRISREDPYVWCDFILDFRQVFPSMESMHLKFLEQYPRVLARIEHGTGYFLKKDTLTDLHTRVPVLKMPVRFKNKSLNPKNKLVEKEHEMRLEEVITMFQDELPLYSSITFKPMDFGIDKYEFNTWTSLRSNITDFQMNMDVVNPILIFIKEVICNSDETVYKYFTSWLRHIIVKPYKKTEVAVFLHSNAKGTGKGSLSYWLKNHVFGTHISNVISGLSKLTQKHNTCIKQKILTIVEEIPAIQGEFHSQFDTMKHLITDPQVTVEPKGVDAYEIPNMVNFLMMSNNQMALKIEKGDRRYACFEVSDCKRGNEEYWNYIHDKVLTEETAKHFYQYMASLCDDDCVSLRQIPKTKLRQQMIENSISAHERFFSDIRDGLYEVPAGAFMDEFKVKDNVISNAMRADALYKIYTNYCSARGEKSLRHRLFFTACAKHIEKGRSKIKGKAVRYYTLK